MLHILGLLGGILALIAAIPYIKDTVKGSTKPNKATWLIWVSLQLIALFAQFSAGGRDSLLLTVGDLIASSTILFLAFFKGETKWHYIDMIAIIGAILGLLLWRILNQPFWALILTVFVDFCGVAPTIRKSFSEPESETLITWVLVGIGAIFGAIAVGQWNFTLLIYPAYLVIANFGVACAMQLGKIIHNRGTKTTT